MFWKFLCGEGSWNYSSAEQYRAHKAQLLFKKPLKHFEQTEQNWYSNL